MAYYMEREKTASTPYLLIDEENSVIKFEGRSYNENVADVFADAKNFLREYLKTDFGTFTVVCYFDYVNSTSQKLLLNMFLDMDRCASEKKRISINWIADEDNDIIIECGENFKSEIKNLEFNIIEKPAGENE